MGARFLTAAVATTAAAVSLAACGSGSEDRKTNTAASESAATAAAPTSAPAPADAAPAAGGPDTAKFEEVAPGSGKGVRIGYISNGEKIGFVKIVSDGIREQAKRAGAELLFCDSEVDAAKALQCARDLRTQNVDVLVEYQNDAKAAPEICQAGPQVPVIAISIEQQPCQVAFMGADNARAGQIAGQAMGDFAKEQWDCDYDAVVLLEAKKTGDINEQRVHGALRAFQDVCGKTGMVRSVDGDGTIDQYQSRFADTLTALPGKHRLLLLTINDDAGLGAIAAAKTQGRAGDIYIAGQGADPTSHCQIAHNPQWVGDAAYFPERFGQIVVPNAIRAAHGEDISEQLLVPHVFVDQDNIGDYYDVSKC
jgi:ribose transport system substrate-binding protein